MSEVSVIVAAKVFIATGAELENDRPADPPVTAIQQSEILLPAESERRQLLCLNEKAVADLALIFTFK